VAANKSGAFPNDAPLLMVPDVLEGLIALARAARARAVVRPASRFALVVRLFNLTRIVELR